MSNIPALGQEAIEHARRGDLEQAIATARRAVAAHKDDFGLRIFLAMLHVRRTELDEARSHFRAAIAINPADPFPQLELIRVLIGLDELDEAAAMLSELRFPGTEPLRLRAMLNYRRGDLTEASKLYQQLVSADPNDFESWSNLGLCLLEANQPQRAIVAFARSLMLRQRLPTRLKWAEAHFASGTAEQALAELRGLARRHPPNSSLWVAIGHLENLLDRPDQSLEALETAVELDGTNADALVALAEALERANNLGRLAAELAKLASLPEPVEKLPLLQARLAYRQGEYERALTLARSAPPSADAGTRAQLIGQSLDRMGDPDAAFDAFSEMNREDARTGSAVAQKASQVRADLAQQRRLLTPEWVAGWAECAPPAMREPAFLVGFPRSGTTLLDTLLMGHPDAVVAEEEPMVAEIGAAVGDVAGIAELGTKEVEALRIRYFELAERHVSDARLRLLIDKNPLAMGAMPIIHRLFPDAPVIFMERHPCDVVLSCFMTRFQPTGMGTNFASLGDAALFYDEMMQLWTKSVEVLSLHVHVIRYERLVDDIEAQLRPLAKFLGLEWFPQLLDHRATARKRDFIGTPSYAQVTEPVNSKAVGRWTRYRKQLEPVLPILEPWAALMDYEV
jgi:tetratricopeptide (TPR) repeat protein